MIQISERFLEAYQPPKRIVKQSYDLNEVGNIHNQMRTKQVIHLTVEELLKLAHDKNSWANESDADAVLKMRTSNDYRSDYDFSNQTDGYGISEYLGDAEKYIPNLYYLWWAIHNDADIFINVYDGYKLMDMSKRNDMLKEKIIGHTVLIHGTDDERFTLPPNDELSIPLGKVMYNKFATNNYAEDVNIPTLMDPVTILSINLPYDIYQHQMLPHNIYMYDILNKTFSFGSKSKVEFIKIVRHIYENGIDKPIFLRMYGQTLSSPDEETSLILLAAMLLKLPSIPVNIYISSECDTKNNLFDKAYELLPKHSYYINPMFINKSLGPNIIVTRTKHSSEDIIKLSSIYPMEKYVVANQDDFVTVRRFDSTIECEVEDKDQKIHDENLKKANDQISSEIDKQIEKLQEKAKRQEKALKESAVTSEMLKENK